METKLPNGLVLFMILALCLIVSAIINTRAAYASDYWAYHHSIQEETRRMHQNELVRQQQLELQILRQQQQELQYQRHQHNLNQDTRSNSNNYTNPHEGFNLINRY